MIWRKLPTLQTLLIHIIPESLWLVAKADDPFDRMTSSRPVTLSSSFGADDLKKLLERSNLVREFGTGRIGHTSRRNFKIVNDGYDRLFSLLPAGQSLFPRLRMVDMPLKLFDRRGSQARLVLGESLPIERLQICDFTDKERTLLCSVGHTEFITTHTAKPNKRAGPWIIPAHRINAIVEIGLIPNLRQLVLNISHFDQFEPPPPPMQQDLVYFPDLKNAKIIADSPQVLCNFISMLEPVEIESLTIERSERNHNWEVETIFKAIGQLDPCLQELTLHNDYSADVFRRFDANTSNLEFKALKHLNRLAALTSLHIRLGCCVVLDDAELAKVATFHPRLRSLQFYDREVNIASNITCRGVLALTSALRNLEDLALRFDASQHPSPSEVYQIVPHPNLTSWDVCTSKLDDPGLLAKFIKLSFPSLEYLDIGWSYICGLGSEIEPVYETGNIADQAEISSNGWMEICTLLSLK